MTVEEIGDTGRTLPNEPLVAPACAATSTSRGGV